MLSFKVTPFVHLPHVWKGTKSKVELHIQLSSGLKRLRG